MSFICKYGLGVVVAMSLVAFMPGDAAAQTQKNKKATKDTLSEPPIIQVPVGIQTKSIQVDRVVVRIPSNKVIGKIQGGMLCTKREDFRLKGGTFNMADPAYIDAMRNDLMAAGYNVVGDPNVLFKDRDEGRAEFIVGGMITDIQADICYWEGIMNESGGEAQVVVDWQVYSSLNRQVVYQRQVRGRSTVAMKKNGEDEVIIEAYASAVRGLLADQSFYKLMVGDVQASATMPSSAAAANPPASSPAAATQIPRLALSQKPFQDHATETRGNVVTVFAGGGSGSGFFVADRYLITNQHVVGAATFVKVKLITGREILGEVIATDSARDVALVQTEVSGLAGLPLFTEDVSIGSGVFAIGSPLDEKNEGTVSAGIVSSYRKEDDGQRYIQSDVNVMPGNSGGPLLDSKGNVIGLTVSGQIDPRTGGGTGLNYFIPIADAMAKLGLQFR